MLPILALVVALLPTADAADLRLRLTVPGQAPFMVSVDDIELGVQPDLVFTGEDRTRYMLSSDISEAEAGYQISFVLEQTTRRRLGKARSELISQPTMTAPAGAWATFYMGKTTASVSREGSSTELFEGYALHGYVLDWSISEGGPSTADASAMPD